MFGIPPRLLVAISPRLLGIANRALSGGTRLFKEVSKLVRNESKGRIPLAGRFRPLAGVQTRREVLRASGSRCECE